MKPREYLLMTECVEQGVQYGVMRSFKHHDKPDTGTICEAVVLAVMNEIAERWSFDDDDSCKP